MGVQRRDFLLLVTLAAVTAMPAMGQTPASSGTQGAASIPDFSGIWGNPYLYGIEPPLTGPGPVVNKTRMRQILDVDGRRFPAANAPLISDFRQLVGDHTNPILKPEAAEVVKKAGAVALAGVTYPSPRNQCWPQGVPFIFFGFATQLLQQPDKITILYDYDHEVRRLRMNQQHPVPVTPSWPGIRWAVTTATRRRRLHNSLVRDQNLSACVPRLAGRCLCEKPA
jgi:hypothetical protein